MKIFILSLCGIFLFAIIIGCGLRSKQKFIKTKTCSSNYELLLCEEKEMVELAFQKKYNLYLKNTNTQSLKKITGINAITPKPKRYLDKLIIKDFGKDINVFTTHYVYPKNFTKEEFDLICKNYEEIKPEWKEIEKQVCRLIYGNQTDFHEVFVCPDNKFFLITDILGGISIVEDSSYNLLSIPLENRKQDVIGSFNDKNELQFTLGKLQDKTHKGFYGRKVAIIEVNKNEELIYLDREIIWSELLYNKYEFAINEDYLLKSKNKDGKLLSEEFIYIKGK